MGRNRALIYYAKSIKFDCSHYTQIPVSVLV